MLARRLTRSLDLNLLPHKQARLVWVWGPVTQYSVDLQQIDPASGGCGSVMQLIARPHARRSTRKMLLDSFMTGFLHKLYRQKWDKFGWKLHWARRVLDVAALALIGTIALELKASLVNAGSGRMRRYILCFFVLVGLLVEEEARYAFLFLRAQVRSRTLRGSHDPCPSNQLRILVLPACLWPCVPSHPHIVHCSAKTGSRCLCRCGYA